jgi:two-component system copper resistance phosphate regulon response regulator CusR
MKVLIIEDEPKLNEFLKKGLEQQGYAVDSAMNGSAGLELASMGNYDLVILDIMLPGQNGFEVLENLRHFEIKIPVIIISALSSSDRVIEGLDKGAIDYIKKPFDFGELMARIRAAVRRGDAKNFTKYKLGDFQLDLLSRKAWMGDQEIFLTKREFGLMELLLTRTNRVVTKTEIAEKIWEVNFDMGSNVIEVHLSQLRKKLGSNDLIRTKIGTGYYIEGELIKS